jgi:hypothetical protein
MRITKQSTCFIVIARTCRATNQNVRAVNFIRHVKYKYSCQQQEQSDLLNKYRLNVNGVLNEVYLMIVLLLFDPVQII